ncbi:hypothetical protein PJL18_03891 [Paenarthrobacter nicotinovorans]|nr:hypothetical protein [Paenarthrobacter nicotinovorans]
MAEAKPKALPPVKTTASTVDTKVVGSRASVSCVPGPPPRTSMEPTVPGGGRTTVTPLSHPPSFFCMCPTRIPGTSVIAVMGPFSTPGPVMKRESNLKYELVSNAR